MCLIKSVENYIHYDNYYASNTIQIVTSLFAMKYFAVSTIVWSMSRGCQPNSFFAFDASQSLFEPRRGATSEAFLLTYARSFTAQSQNSRVATRFDSSAGSRALS